ncbi:MAG TPA: Hsp70 family protein, partial [Anaerolineales bacterium]|nr:Hsp70 family protein [Anaerolineales bacterium]
VGDLAKTYLSLLKQRAEDILGEPVHAVTLGRPVKFSDSPEQDHKAQETLRQAAQEAGFREVDFELEPIAAALDYEQSMTEPQNVIIFDFGGGTLDIAVMRLGDPSKRKVYASGGVDIAGSDFDRVIIENRMLAHFGLGRVKHHPEILEMINAVPDWMALPYLGTPINKNILEKAIRAGIAPVQVRALQGLIYNDLAFTFYNRVEAGKIALSSEGATIVSLEDKDIALWELYTRHQFETDIQHYLIDVEKVLLDTIARSGLEPGEIDAVVKTGGSSNIPLFTEMLRRIFGKEKVKESSSFTSVVAGLAIKASM